MSDDTNMRAEFEAYMRSQNACTRFYTHGKGTAYRTVSVERAWQLWQAAWNRRTDTRAAVPMTAEGLDSQFGFVTSVARRLALEEAAKVCDSVNNFDNPMTATDCADAIRAIATKTTEG